MTNPTFDTLRAKASKLGTVKDTLGDRIDAVITDAEINANDTVYTEKEATEAEWHKVFMSSLELLLGCSTDKAVIRWFVRQGVRF